MQIKKDEEELNRAWGSGPPPKPQPQQYRGPKAPKGTAQLTAGPTATAAGGGGVGGVGDGQQQQEEEQEQQPQQRLTVVQIFGDAKAVEKAVAMIEEAVANREQKQKQRQAQYDRKREQKRKDRWVLLLGFSRGGLVWGFVFLGASNQLMLVALKMEGKLRGVGRRRQE